ncbi:hypothetical protein GGS26DRAFT_561247 [Hypomontagnella submonticulosa]|nr:hypothetical protein GGS26DRAFT_561247 [Hypomontagnella submonticulosa]
MTLPKNKAKVKSGCRTCKTRRVKCDEGWPACSRCLSTGRICEGYGIWGGGGNEYGRRSMGPNINRSLKAFLAPALIENLDKEESQCLEWFTYRSALKLPGAFRSAFWETLVFQAASNEPAVFHAILALSSAHRREGLHICAPRTGGIPDKPEQFTLRHYSKSITHLQPHFSDKSNSSVRVALITCLMFIIMEFLRGNYKSGMIHLQNGMKLLNECQVRSNSVDRYTLFLEPCHNSVDAWITETFIRLDVQAKFLGHGSHHLRMVQEDCTSEVILPELTFKSPNQARQRLDRIFSQIFYINHECRHVSRSGHQAYHSAMLLKQVRIKAKLDSWHHALESSTSILLPNEPSTYTVAYPLLLIYYTVAKIMADTCLWPADELRYDVHTTAFEFILDRLKYVQKLSRTPDLIKIIHFSDMSSSVADLGALPALYYVAVKCRVRGIRHAAVQTLNALSHKEGLWNAPLVASVTEEVVRIEEGDFYKGFDVAATGLPTLPESYRLHDVEVELPEDYAGTVTLNCKRKSYDHNWEVITRKFVYDIETQCWIDKAGG